MKTSIIAAATFAFIGLLHVFAGPDLSPDAVKWCDWTGPNVGVSTSFYANGGTFAVTAGGDGSFGKGMGEVVFTSNNPAPIAEHQFGSTIWGQGGPTSLFDASALAGKTGIEILVNVDSSSTSGKICIKLTATGDDVYSQTIDVEKGSIQCVLFPIAGFKSTKNPGTPLTDFSILNGTIQITDGWNGYPGPQQAAWICKFSNVYTYGGGTAAH